MLIFYQDLQLIGHFTMKMGLSEESLHLIWESQKRENEKTLFKQELLLRLLKRYLVRVAEDLILKS